jgi:hypothetical protein
MIDSMKAALDSLESTEAVLSEEAEINLADSKLCLRLLLLF